MKEGSESDGPTTESKEAPERHHGGGANSAPSPTTNGTSLLGRAASPTSPRDVMEAKLAALGAELVAAAAATTAGDRRPTPPTPREVMGATLAALGAELVAAATSTTADLFGHQGLDHWKGNGDHSAPNTIGKLDSVASAAAGRDKIFICGVCNRCFGYKHVLQNHERTHTGEKPFECKECHKRFTRDHHLKTHMRLHTGEKPYHCTHCERQFVQVANLRRHLRVHTGERPYACELCASRFSDSNQLKAHMLIHKGEKPFECPKCLGRFRRRHHLMHHKCPRDDVNIGKSRRGRRPKGYGQLLHGATPGLLSVETSVPDATVSVNSVVPLLSPPPVAHSTILPPHEKSRRKPSHTIRILTPQQRELFLRDKDNIQTQAIDMSLSPTPEGHALALIRPPPSTRYVPTMEGVLDLSKSRSDDSEAEPIEEEVEGDLVDEDDEEDELIDEDFEDHGGCSDDGLMGAPGGGLSMRLSASSWRDDSSRDSHVSVRSSSSSSHHHPIHRPLVVPPHRLPHMDNGTIGGPSGDEMSDSGHGISVSHHPGRHESHPQVTMT